MDSDHEYSIDLVEQRLWSGDQAVPLGNRAFQMLRLFVEKPDRLLTKDRILDAVWGDICVSENQVKEYVHDLRAALGDDPRQPRYIETIRGRGYRFLGGIRIIADRAEPDTLSYPPTGMPSLAVLPLVNLSDDPEQEYFSDGITDDIITELSRFPELGVVARNSAFSFKNHPVDAARVARELGVGYVLEGSVQRAGDRLRVTARLFERNSGRHIWAEKYDRGLKDVFDLQDDLTRHVVGSIAPQVELAELERGRSLDSNDLSAYELALKAQSLTYDAVRIADREKLIEAMSLAERALATDRLCTQALWTRGMGLVFQYLYGWDSDAGEALDSAIEIADHLVGMNPSSAKSYIVRAWAYQYRRQYDLALADYRRALELNPNLALNLFTMAWSEAVAGLPEAAREHAQLALRLSPRDTDIWLAWAYATLELAGFTERDFSDAVKWGKLAIQLHGRMPVRQLVMIAAHGHLGDKQAAERHIDAVRGFAADRLAAVLGGDYQIFRAREHNALLREGLRLAGL